MPRKAKSNSSWSNAQRRKAKASGTTSETPGLKYYVNMPPNGDTTRTDYQNAEEIIFSDFESAKRGIEEIGFPIGIRFFFPYDGPFSNCKPTSAEKDTVYMHENGEWIRKSLSAMSCNHKK